MSHLHLLQLSGGQLQRTKSLSSCRVKIKHDGLDVIVGGLYHPPKPSNYKPEELLKHIDVVIEELTLKFPGALIVLAGDMNKLPIDRITEATGLIPIVHQPTRKENILDQILTSQPCYTRVQVITSSVKSDHKAIIARSDNTPLQRTNQQNKMCRYRKKSPSQNADFLIHMAEHGTNLITESVQGTVQKEFNHFYDKALNLLDRFYPETNITIRARDPAYMTPSIKSKLRKKNKLMHRGRIEEADQISKRIGIEIVKSNSVCLKAVDNKNSSKDLWAAVKRLTNREHGEVIAENVDASIFNSHYANISSDLNYTQPLLKLTAVQRLTTFSEFGVFKLLDQLKPTATGLDKLPAWFLRLGAPFFAKPLANLFNQSIQESIVPIQWKEAYIKPIQKIPSPTLPSDYRPISITLVLARTMKKIVVKTFIYPAMADPPPDLQFEDQYAFKPAGSTTAAIIDMLQTITEMLQSNPYVIVVALDFSKAFDTVRHASVTEKTARLKMPDNAYNWIVDFLECHSHQTVFGGQRSEFLKI